MKIAVIGTGYVGLVTGVCLADIGHEVTCLDIDEAKVELLRSGKSPIYEEGLEELLVKNIDNGRIQFTTSYEEGLAGKEAIYLGVGTPQSEDGSADLRFIHAACDSIGEHLQNDAVIVTKSTVPIGTNEHIYEYIQERLKHNVTIKIVSNPEFLRQGSAVHDTFHGDRIIIGADDEEALKAIEEVYKPFGIPILKTDLRSAEMIKYASNAFLATKISFINEIANLCEHVGANIENVAKGMGMDKRIGQFFLNAGIGYGGSCFPKDTNALISIGKSVDYKMPILQSVVNVNEMQKRIIIEKLEKRFGSLKGRTIALLGLSFKPNTDDMREAPSIPVSKALVEAGVTVKAYDPVAMENAKKVIPSEVQLQESVDQALADAECAVILTEWKEFIDYGLDKYKEKLVNPIIFDGRNCFDVKEANRHGIEYYSIGRPSETK